MLIIVHHFWKKIDSNIESISCSIMLRSIILLLIIVSAQSGTKTATAAGNKNDQETPRRLFLHIGPHKTASTYIQSVLASEVSSYCF